MNRGTMRTMLRRRLQEIEEYNWDDNTLNELLDLGLHFAQKRIMGLNPRAFVYIDLLDVVQGTYLYPVPAGMWFELKVRWRGEVGGTHAKIEKFDDFVFDARDSRAQGVNGGGVGLTSVGYALIGRYMRISPVPTLAVPGGIELTYVPTLTMSDDVQTPEVPIGLHMGIVAHAQYLALGETGESAAAAREIRDDYFADLPSYYLTSGGETEHLHPDIDKGGASSFSPGTHYRE